MKTALTLAILTLTVAATGQQQDTQENPARHHCAMMKRGDHAMGFSQEKTTHHFRLLKDGGVIEVVANDPKDAESREQIRRHLSHIAQMFSAGNFDVPMFIHGATPPGVPAMTELRDQITYRFQETANGAAVRIGTANTRALEAVHAFLRFQIAEHKTGDPGDVDGPTGK
jgi:hypothetical protein